MGQPLSTTGLTGWEPPVGQAWGLLCPRLAPSEAGQGLPPAPHPSGRSAPAGPSPVLCSSGLAQIGADRRLLGPLSSAESSFSGVLQTYAARRLTAVLSRATVFTCVCVIGCGYYPIRTLPAGRGHGPVCSPSRGRTRGLAQGGHSTNGGGGRVSEGRGEWPSAGWVVAAPRARPCGPPVRSGPQGCSSPCPGPGGFLASLLRCVRGSYEPMSLGLCSECGRGGMHHPLITDQGELAWCGPRDPAVANGQPLPFISP